MLTTCRCIQYPPLIVSQNTERIQVRQAREAVWQIKYFLQRFESKIVTSKQNYPCPKSFFAIIGGGERHLYFQATAASIEVVCQILSTIRTSKRTRRQQFPPSTHLQLLGPQGPGSNRCGSSVGAPTPLMQLRGGSRWQIAGTAR